MKNVYNNGMEKRLTYTVNIERDEDGIYIVSVPSLPGCLTQGKTFDDAMKMAQEAIVAFITTLVRRGKKIPTEKSNMVSPFAVSIISPKLAI